MSALLRLVLPRLSLPSVCCRRNYFCLSYSSWHPAFTLPLSLSVPTSTYLFIFPRIHKFPSACFLLPRKLFIYFSILNSLHFSSPLLANLYSVCFAALFTWPLPLLAHGGVVASLLFVPYICSHSHSLLDCHPKLDRLLLL